MKTSRTEQCHVPTEQSGAEDFGRVYIQIFFFKLSTFPSHQMFRHMYEALNVDEKN
jgi:hypothetical protein